MTRIGLGTAQLGLPYGNKASKELMPREECFAILDYALSNRVDFFDTAIGYGESESRIGQFDVLKHAPLSTVSSKIPAADQSLWSDENLYLKWVQKHINESLIRLKIPYFELLQFHQCQVEFLTNSKVQSVLRSLVSSPQVKALGVSVYSMEQAQAAIASNLFVYLQVPVNIVDHRFLDPEFLALVQSKKMKLIARSALLQGILVPHADLPKVKRRDELANLRGLAVSAASQISPHESLESIALRFLFKNYTTDLSVVLIGVDSVQALRHNLSTIENAKQPLSSEDLKCFEPALEFALERKLVNPINWLE